uniref:Uncharacterized protein n=1 Tax=Populus trichocarpa TaxID=3694 RepID=A9PB84_POPTR|nr:unknown [Populus trichocarpa]
MFHLLAGLMALLSTLQKTWTTFLWSFHHNPACQMILMIILLLKFVILCKN